MGAFASVLAPLPLPPPPPPPTLASLLCSWDGTLFIGGIAALSAAITLVSSDENALRRNLGNAEMRIAQLEAQLKHEQQEGPGRMTFAGINSVQRVSETMRRLRHVDGLTHFAVAGTVGSGKSSLINSIRGLHTRDPGAAGVGTGETTMAVTRHEDPDLERNPYVWYDSPGLGTLRPNQSDVAYFLEQGLFIFDCVIVVFDARFTAADIAVLKCCHKLDISAYIVRSKALMHIQNTVGDMAGRGDTAGNPTDYCRGAREKFLSETRATVANNLKEAGLEEQRVYVVDKTTMLQVVLLEDPGDKLLHEGELLSDVLCEMQRRSRAR